MVGILKRVGGGKNHMCFIKTLTHSHSKKMMKKLVKNCNLRIHVVVKKNYFYRCLRHLHPFSLSSILKNVRIARLTSVRRRSDDCAFMYMYIGWADITAKCGR